MRRISHKKIRGAQKRAPHFNTYENLRKLWTEQRTDNTLTAIIGRPMGLTRIASAKRISALAGCS